MAADGLLVVHGGGPTAVINASLYGAVAEALATQGVGRVLGALGGVGGITDGDLVDFGQVPREKLDLLPFSPSSAIGTSRKPLEDEDYRELAYALDRQGIRWLLCTGGNGTPAARSGAPATRRACPSTWWASPRPWTTTSR